MAPHDHFRAFGRRPVGLAVTVAAAEGEPHAARLLDIGLGGACVELAQTVAEGQTVTLELTTPNLWDPLVLHATVAWVRPTAAGARAGIQFDHERSATLVALVELLGAERFD